MADEGKGTLEVARALYAFKATVGKTLSFREHEQFIIYHPSTKEKNWWQVVNAQGQLGYVPSNYVQAVEVTAEFMGEFLDGLIDKLRGEELTSDKEEVLARLMTRRRRLDGEFGGGDEKALSRTPSIISIPPAPNHAQAPPVPQHANQSAPPVPQHANQSAPPVPQHGQSASSHVGYSSYSASSHKGYATLPSQDTPKKKPVPAEKTVSVKRRVAELSSQMGESNTGTMKRSGSKSADRQKANQARSIPPPEPKTPTQDAPKVVEERTIEKPKEKMEERPVEKIPERSSSRRSSVQLTRKITEETVYQLVEQVRCHTDLSHERSRVAVAVVLTSMERYIPDHPVLASMLHLLQGPMRAPKPMLEQTHDAQRLHVIFNELTSCKDDAQQRSWMLHEDEDIIIDYIKELTSILTDADSTVCQHVVSSEQYAGVVVLAQYYQMETRWTIRQPLLTSLGVLCGLDRAVVSILLTSVLPCELARDMAANPDHMARLNFSALLLTMIFSMGEPMPIIHFEHLGVEFLSFVLDLIENPPSADVDDQIPDLFVTLLLSYNLQFKPETDNPLIQALSTRRAAKTFTEKILILFNREDDPVRIFDHQPAPAHSVLKLFVDVFSCSATAALFYTNDVKVLIDIIVRQLADLSPGEPRRNQYLGLCRVVMRNPGYAEHHHRRDDLHKCFTRIFCEEADVSRDDQRLVREISNEFPQYFKA